MKNRLIVLGISVLFLTTFSSCEKEETSTSCNVQCENSVQCNEVTQSGSSCQNNTLNCCGYCYLHTSQN
jgi:hypothetical protein